MDSSESMRADLAALKLRLEELECSHSDAFVHLRRSIEELERQMVSDPVASEEVIPPPLPPRPAPVDEALEPTEVAEPSPIEEVPMVPDFVARREMSESETGGKEPTDSPVPAVKGSVEMQIGRVWLVRIGVVLLVTGLVLLGNYAYQNWIRDLSAGLRLTALYLTALGIFAGGWGLSLKERMERFGEVLMAGGMAFFYWCTFAAHQVERLRVIESPVIAGTLLLGAAAAIVGVSIWRKAPLTAMMGLLMASYATTIQPLGWLAAMSNVFLSAAGVFLMRRPGWGSVGVVGMAGIYGSFIWWNLAGASGAPLHVSGMWFVAASWALFALPGVVGMSGRFERSMSDRGKAWFVGANNAVCFGLISLQWLLLEFDSYWRVPAVFGLVLIGLGAVSRGRNGGSSTQLSQGISMITLALFLKLQGYQLAVGLGMESLALAGAFWRFRRMPELSFSVLATIGAVAAVFAMPQTTTLSGGIVALLLCGTTYLLRSGVGVSGERTEMQKIAEVGSLTGLAGASLVAFFGWIIELDAVWQAGLSAAIALGLSALHLVVDSKRWLPQLREASVAFAVGTVGLIFWNGDDVASVSFSVVAMIAAGSAFLWERCSKGSGIPYLTWLHALTFPLALGLAIHSWPLSGRMTLILMAGAVPGMVMAFRWLGCRSLVVGSSLLLLLSLVMTVDVGGSSGVYGFLTMVSALAALGFAVYRTEGGTSVDWAIHGITRSVAVAAWLWAWITLLPWGWIEVVPLSTVALWLTVRGLKLNWRLPEVGAFALMSLFGFVGAIGSTVWCQQADPSLNHGWGFALGLGMVIFSPAMMVAGSVTVRRLMQGAFALATTLWTTLTSVQLFDWQPVAILWTAVGFVFVSIGLWRRMATLRHAGFILLAVSLGKLFVVDVWAFGTFTRVMAFIALGVALVVLGFFYNRFASVLKRLLESEDQPEKADDGGTPSSRPAP